MRNLHQGMKLINRNKTSTRDWTKDEEEPGEPGHPVKKSPGQPPEREHPVEQGQLTKPGHPVEPGQLTEPGRPAELGQPVEPGHPVKPRRPVDFQPTMEPVQPVKHGIDWSALDWSVKEPATRPKPTKSPSPTTGSKKGNTYSPKGFYWPPGHNPFNLS